MKRYWSGIFLGFCLVALIMIMLHRYVGEAILITLLYFLWMAKLIIHSVPKLVPWLLFLMVAFFMAVHYIGRLRTGGKAHRAELRDNTGQVSYWAKRIHKTAPGGYNQRDNARLLGRMAVGMLNLQGHKKLKKPAAQLVAEASDIPDDIKAYLIAGLEFGSTAGIPKLGRIRRFLMWLGYKKTGPLDLDLERVVKFIESYYN